MPQTERRIKAKTEEEKKINVLNESEMKNKLKPFHKL